MRSCSALESVHQSQVFSVLLLAFLSIVNGWADRFGRRGDQRVKRTKFLHLIVQPEEDLPRLLNDLIANDRRRPKRVRVEVDNGYRGTIIFR